MNIGVFDSGLGGLAILRELLKALPEYDYMYLGDNARVPYGGRSLEVIYEFTRQAVDFLFRNNCVLVILACNTATAAALRKLQREYLPSAYPGRRILGVIRPTAEAVAESKAKRVGILATKATVLSESFVKEINKINPRIRVFQKAGPLLVPFIEEGEVGSPAFSMVLKSYVKPLLGKKIDSLVLACTHYELVRQRVRNLLGPGIRVFAEGQITAEKLGVYLQRHPGIGQSLSKKSKRVYLITDFHNDYLGRMKLFLGQENISDMPERAVIDAKD